MRDLFVLERFRRVLRLSLAFLMGAKVTDVLTELDIPTPLSIIVIFVSVFVIAFIVMRFIPRGVAPRPMRRRGDL